MNFYKICQINTIQYSLPKDKRQRLYDFYMMSLLPNNYQNEKLDWIFKETKEELVKELKQHLLNAVFVSISAEIRHFANIDAMDENFIDDIHKIGQNFTEEIFNFLRNQNYNTDEINFLQIYNNRVGRRAIKNIPQTRDRYRKPDKFKKIDYFDSYQNIKQLIKETNIDDKEFVELARDVFLDLPWNENYGGKAWAEIADSWIKLYESNNMNKDIVYIDHIYDLQHNNDTVFNKLKEYQKTDFEWILDALDHKASITSPEELYEHCSPTMKRIARYALKDAFGTTEEGMSNLKDSFWNEKIDSRMVSTDYILSNKDLFKTLLVIPENIFFNVYNKQKDNIIKSIFSYCAGITIKNMYSSSLADLLSNLLNTYNIVYKDVMSYNSKNYIKYIFMNEGGSQQYTINNNRIEDPKIKNIIKKIDNNLIEILKESSAEEVMHLNDVISFRGSIFGDPEIKNIIDYKKLKYYEQKMLQLSPAHLLEKHNLYFLSNCLSFLFGREKLEGTPEYNKIVFKLEQFLNYFIEKLIDKEAPIYNRLPQLLLILNLPQLEFAEAIKNKLMEKINTVGFERQEKLYSNISYIYNYLRGSDLDAVAQRFKEEIFKEISKYEQQQQQAPQQPYQEKVPTEMVNDQNANYFDINNQQDLVRK